MTPPPAPGTAASDLWQHYDSNPARRVTKGGGAPATECRAADVRTRRADGSPGTMRRWVLDTSVWEKLLAGHGFELSDTDTIRDPGPAGAPPMTTLIFRARRRSDGRF
ncbi:hypothetical protein ACIQM0_30445 [Streptomyces sp. NPDC091387]|uniref:hypothetical protein n=1 Tax=Streptomyces sp. NPDC091387 TaxID=3365998 RepID=UPI003811D158